MKGIPKKEDPEPKMSTDGTLGLGTRYPVPRTQKCVGTTRYLGPTKWDPGPETPKYLGVPRPGTLKMKPGTSNFL